jgi:hypothetical protein
MKIPGSRKKIGRRVNLEEQSNQVIGGHTCGPVKNRHSFRMISVTDFAKQVFASSSEDRSAAPRSKMLSLSDFFWWCLDLKLLLGDVIRMWLTSRKISGQKISKSKCSVLSLLLVACQYNGNAGSSSTVQAVAKSGTDGGDLNALDEACQAVLAKKLKGLDKEMALICSPTGATSLAKKLVSAAYNGKNSVAEATKQIKLSSNGDDTEVIFAGALQISKSLEGIKARQDSIINIAIDDKVNEVSLTNKVLSRSSNAAQGDCYVTKQVVDTSVFGFKISDSSQARECFQSLGPNVKGEVSYRSLVSQVEENSDNPADNAVTLQLETSPSNTYILSVMRKIMKNQGFPSIAEGKIKTQPPNFITKVYNILSTKNPVHSVSSSGPKFGDAGDNDLIGQGDWAQGRTKLSCKPGEGVIAVSQQNVYGDKTQKPAQLSLDCQATSKAVSYRTEEPPQGIPSQYEIQCQDNEYVAGISFVRYNDKATIIVDGTRSLLCAESQRTAQTCTWRARSCNDGEVLHGLRVKREGGLICDSVRQDDDGKGCYTTQSVQCCK